MPAHYPPALAALMQTAAQGPPQQEPPPEPPPEPDTQGGGALAPATDAERAQFGLPVGTLVVRVSQNDPAFAQAAGQAVARGRQLVSVGDKVFAVPAPQQPPQQPEATPGAGMPEGLIGGQAPPGGLLG